MLSAVQAWSHRRHFNLRRLSGILAAVVLASTLSACNLFPSPPATILETGSYTIFGITSCPDGYAVVAVHASTNTLLCRQFGLGTSDLFVDYSTQRSGMHACPLGTYVRGYRDDKNELLCAYDAELGYSTFSGPEVFSPTSGPPPQYNYGQSSMHICSNSNTNEVLTGIQATQNIFLCRAMPTVQPAGPLTGKIPATFDPKLNPGPNDAAAPVRGLTCSVTPSTCPGYPRASGAGMSVATWETLTRNWLDHILNIPVPGQPGVADPWCVVVTPPADSAIQFNQSPACARSTTPMTIRLSSVVPAQTGFGCFNPTPEFPRIAGGVVTPPQLRIVAGQIAAPATEDYYGFGARQYYVTYGSPVIPGATEDAYLTVPEAFSAASSAPAVVVTHGHDDMDNESTARCPQDPDHANALRLAERGAVTLAPETVGFGNYQTFDGGTLAAGCPNWPNLEGDPEETTFLANVCQDRTGTFMQRYILDNVIRVSMLSDMDGVDPQKLATTGLSMGGWQALWTAAVDTRIHRTAVAGIYESLSNMESAGRPLVPNDPTNDSDQEIPSLTTGFLKDNNSASNYRIDPALMLIGTPDIAALVFEHSALLSTWGHYDPGYTTSASEVSEIDTQSKTLAALIGSNSSSGYSSDFYYAENLPYAGSDSSGGVDLPHEYYTGPVAGAGINFSSSDLEAVEGTFVGSVEWLLGGWVSPPPPPPFVPT
jgi:dienelactone hydrolase